MDQTPTTQTENPTATSWEELLAEGKRCLAAGDVASGVESFQSACSLMAEQYGQLAKELAEPYYLYGKALLECARQDNTVLGSGIPVPDDAASSDEEEDEEEEEEEGEERGEEEGKVEKTGDTDRAKPTTPGDPGEATKSDNKSQPSPDETQNETEKESEVAVKPVSSSDPDREMAGGSSDRGAGPSGGEGEKPEGVEEEEEETDLKLAWEVLELARVICQKEESEEYKIKLSDVYFALGEVALESDQMDQAVVDMNSGLQLRELLLEPHDRRLAEAHFNLGLAYALQKDTKRSIQEYKCARNSLSLKREKLVSETAGKEDDEKKELDEELADLDSLLPDLDAKIKDACEEEKQQEEEEETTTTSHGFPGSVTEDKSNGGSKAPISDITHLVRKRPAAREGDTVEGKSQKRIRIEQDGSEPEPAPAANGTASSSPHSSEQW